MDNWSLGPSYNLKDEILHDASHLTSRFEIQKLIKLESILNLNYAFFSIINAEQLTYNYWYNLTVCDVVPFGTDHLYETNNF